MPQASMAERPVALPPVCEERAMPSSTNKLLASLSTRDFDLLEPHLKSVPLGIRKHLEQPNKQIDAAYFPESH